jgi:hypothetical protein
MSNALLNLAVGQGDLDCVVGGDGGGLFGLQLSVLLLLRVRVCVFVYVCDRILKKSERESRWQTIQHYL